MSEKVPEITRMPFSSMVVRERRAGDGRCSREQPARFEHFQQRIAPDAAGTQCRRSAAVAPHFLSFPIHHIPRLRTRCRHGGTAPTAAA